MRQTWWQAIGLRSAVRFSVPVESSANQTDGCTIDTR